MRLDRLGRIQAGPARNRHWRLRFYLYLDRVWAVDDAPDDSSVVPAADPQLQEFQWRDCCLVTKPRGVRLTLVGSSKTIGILLIYLRLLSALIVKRVKFHIQTEEPGKRRDR